MLNRQNYACPLCGQIDRVEKVSALVGAGTARGFYGGNTSGNMMTGISQTNLSKKLSPPIKPVYTAPWGGCSISVIIGSI